MTTLENTPPIVPEAKKGAPIVMIALTVILAAALIFLVVRYFDQKSKMQEMETALTQEKDSLARELKLLAASYDTIKTDNDSLKAGLSREKNKIIKLLSVNASDIQLIKKYKTEITTMREIMKSYIVQIDSLNTRNKILSAENTQIKDQITQVKTTNTQLSKVKEELTAKVEIASVIQAKDIVATSLNKRQKPTTRLNLLDKLKICFTLRENPLAKAGSKEVFMRVLRPDSLVIATSPDNLFDYKGNKLVYSANRTADYMNQDIDMCIFLDNTGDFVVGNYTVELYLEGNMIGKTTFTLTKR
jgi:FlaG/FlaF family flagellin (archaellin)